SAVRAAGRALHPDRGPGRPGRALQVALDIPGPGDDGLAAGVPAVVDRAVPAAIIIRVEHLGDAQQRGHGARIGRPVRDEGGRGGRATGRVRIGSPPGPAITLLAVWTRRNRLPILDCMVSQDLRAPAASSAATSPLAYPPAPLDLAGVREAL